MKSLKRLLYKLIAENKIEAQHAMLIFKEIELNDKYLDDDIAVIGMAARLPMAADSNEFWQNLAESRNCISSLPHARKKDLELLFSGEDKKNMEFRSGGFLKNIDSFDASFFRISPREAAYMDPEQRLLLEVIWQTIEDAGYAAEIHNSKTGVYIGHDHVAGFPYRNFTGGIQNPDTLALTGTYPSILSSRISYILNLKGPSLVIDTACSSGLVALYEACQALRNKVCDLVIAGGISLQLWPVKYKSFKMVETDNTTVRTFDKNSTGTVWGEGICTFLLKPCAQAVKDHDNIYAVIKGMAINNDGASSGITAPNAEAQEDVILRAWKEAKIDPETISYIETHGTGTVMGDPIEIKALNNAFSRFTNKKQFCAIGSLKPSIGHLVSASGTASLVKVILAMKNHSLPATINFREPNPFINFHNSPLYINDKFQDWETDGEPMRAGISCFGFSGTNCHLVLEEAPGYETSSYPPDVPPFLLALSAKNTDSLTGLVDRYITFLKAGLNISIADLCYTANTGRYQFENRLAIVFNDAAELIGKLEDIKHKGFTRQLHAGIYYGVHEITLRSSNENPASSLPESRGDPVKITAGEKENLSLEAGLKFRTASGHSRQKAFQVLCEYYVLGADINWKELLYPEQIRRKVSLPLYPFKQERHWYFPERVGVPPADSRCLLQTSWVPCPLEATDKSSEVQGKILIFMDGRGLGKKLLPHLKNIFTDHYTVIAGAPGTGCSVINDNTFSIDGTYESFNQLLQKIDAPALKTILHLQSLEKETEKEVEIDEPTDIDELYWHTVTSLFYLVRALIANKYKQNLELLLVSDYVNKVTGNERLIRPVNAVLFGMAKVVGLECRNLNCICIDIDQHTTEKEILQEFDRKHSKGQLAYRENERYIEQLETVDPSAIADNNLPIKEQGAYIITGGTGGIGLELGKFLASGKKINLCLLSRKMLPDREKWAGLLVSGKDDKTGAIIRKIQQIEENGSQVTCFPVDVTDRRQLGETLDRIRHTYGPLNGIIHCAGIAGEGYIFNKEDKALKQVLGPKITGTRNLDRLTKTDNPDFFVLCSSIIAITGSAGQSDYAAANSFLESYASYRNMQGQKTLTISWAPWKETGMALRSGYSQTEGPFKSLPTATAIEAFHNVMTKEFDRVVIGEPDNKILNSVKDYIYIRLSGELERIVSETDNGSYREQYVHKTDSQVRLLGRNNGLYTGTEKDLAQLWQRVLGVKEINVEDSFMKLGGDSISATYLLTELEKEFGKFIDISDIFTYQTIEQMAKYIEKESAAQNPLLLSNEEIMNKLASGEITVEKASELRKRFKSKEI